MKMQIKELIKDLKIRNRLNDYPCGDYLHNALRFIRKGMPNVAYGEICCAIVRSGGKLTEEESEYLKEMGKGGVDNAEHCYTPLDEDTLKLLEELKAYRDAEEKGLLLRLPCKVGDWLYYLCQHYNVVIPVRLNEVIIFFVGLDNYSYQYNCCSFDNCGDVYEDYEFDNDDFGKTVFLSKEEAEQKLAEMEGE